MQETAIVTNPDGNTATPEFLYVTVIAASPERVWEGITTAEFTRQYWHSTRVSCDWQVGSEIRFFVDGEAGDEVGCEGKILAVEPNRCLSYTWRFPRNPQLRDEAPSRVTFELEPLGPHTLLRVIHDQFPPGSGMYPAVREGWPLVIAGLKTLLETGRGVDFSALPGD